MAVDAIDLDGVPRFAVQFAVPVIILLEMAVGTVHALFKMNILQMHRLLKFVVIAIGHNVVIAKMCIRDSPCASPFQQ